MELAKASAGAATFESEAAEASAIAARRGAEIAELKQEAVSRHTVAPIDRRPLPLEVKSNIFNFEFKISESNHGFITRNSTIRWRR